MPNSFLKIENLTKIYKSGDQVVTALDNISFSIREGEIFGLLGINGAGKTTLSSILATLHPTTSGSVLFRGKSIYDDMVEYRRNLGFCPQKQNLDMFLNVEENLLFAGRYFLMPEDENKAKRRELMESFGLSKYATFEVGALSGGNKQKLLIARALMHSPKIVILDEPTVGLDPNIRRKLWQVIAGLKKMGTTVILTTHYLDEAEFLSDRVCILHGGKVLLLESLKELKQRHEQARLEDIFVKLMDEAEHE